MSDVLSIRVGEVWRKAGMVAKASGSAITSGTVNHYLLAMSGDNAGKWWKNADQTWAATETATAMTHAADGSWTVELAESPFEAGVIYLEYAKESGDLHIAGEGRLLRGYAALTPNTIADEVYDTGRVFPVANLANAPTGATASYTVSRATVGTLGSLNVERWQYEALGSFEFDVTTAPTTPLSLVAWLPGRPGTAIFRLSSTDGDITVDGTTVTVAADDTYMEDVTTYRWTLDDATDAAIAEGTITVKARPTPEAPPD